jgi:hypothetical protein
MESGHGGFMTWIFVLVVSAALAALFVWAAVRQRRHGGDYTLDQAKRDAERYASGGGGGGGFS